MGSRLLSRLRVELDFCKSWTFNRAQGFQLEACNSGLALPGLRLGRLDFRKFPSAPRANGTLLVTGSVPSKYAPDGRMDSAASGWVYSLSVEPWQGRPTVHQVCCLSFNQPGGMAFIRISHHYTPPLRATCVPLIARKPLALRSSKIQMVYPGPRPHVIANRLVLSRLFRSLARCGALSSNIPMLRSLAKPCSLRLALSHSYQFIEDLHSRIGLPVCCREAGRTRTWRWSTTTKP